MITKDRLEELIKQKATIYYASHKNIGEIIYHDDPTNSVIEHKLIENKIKNLGGVYEIISSKRFFETKEEAEEYLEFGNIQRVQQLKFPLWNETVYKRFQFIEFNIYGEFNKVCIFDYNLDHKNSNMEITICDDEEQEIIFDKPLTKENYDEARRICKKLFLGE